MPRFHFNVEGDNRHLDLKGTSVGNREEAQEQAEKLAYALANSNPHLRDLAVVVRDESGKEFYRVPLAAKGRIH